MLPVFPILPLQKVSYYGVVYWTSPNGVYTSFPEQGWKTTDNTSIVLSLLTPSTEYMLRVGVVSDDGQSGDEVPISVTTQKETGGMYKFTVYRICEVNY